MKKLTALLLIAAIALSLCACGATAEKTTQPEATAAAEETAQPEETETAMTPQTDEENYNTGDASLDNPGNADGIGEREMLVVSFGTSYNDSRRLTIGAIENDIAAAFPEYSVRRAFTSQIIIDHVLSRDNIKIDNVTEALARASANGVKELVVVPTHLMDGYEYNDLVNEIANYADAFDRISVGRPLLDTDEDFAAVAQAVVDACKEYDDGETAICLMGHGTEADSNGVYEKMQNTLTAMGAENYFVGTVEAEPSLDTVLSLVKNGSYKRVVLRPLMVVAGDHANNDMAGDEEDSWKSVFEAEGYEVLCVVEGLGQLESIRDIYVRHARAAVEDTAK